MLYRKMLRTFQNAAAEFIKQTKRCALFIDMGLGKTVTVLTVVRDLVYDMQLTRVLIIAPPRVARKVWSDEVRNWEHTKDLLLCTVIQGTPKKRLELLQKGSDIHMISHDLVEWLLESGVDLSVYDMIVVDESSKFKEMKTKRYKALKEIVHNIKALDKYLVLLTGTPAPNGLHELYGQIFLLDSGERLMSSKAKFLARWFTTGYNGTGYRIKGDWAAQHIRDRIEDIVFTLRETDYSELPPIIHNTVNIDLDDEVMKSYKKFEREYILQIPDGSEIKTATAAGLTNKLLQLANGTVYDAEKNERFIHAAKIKALREIVDSAPGEPMLVAYAYKSDIRAIMKEFPEAVLLGNNARTIDDWNAGRIPMLLVHPMSAGHGLNLQFGGSIAVWYGLTWSLEGYMQLNKRLHRKGQLRTTMIHHLICTGTIDETLMKVLASKDKTQDDFLNSLRRIIEDVLETA